MLLPSTFARKLKPNTRKFTPGANKDTGNRETSSLLKGTIGVSAFIAIWYILSHSITPLVPDPIVTVTTVVPKMIEPWYYKSIFIAFTV